VAVTSDVLDHQARVLIVDDESHNRKLLEVMLAPEGLLLLAAASGEEALALVAQQPPDLILLDVMMPGMDGYQVADAIKANPATKNIPIIMVTALDDRQARMSGLRAGAEDFLAKPVDRAELCVRVRNLLRLKAYGDHHDKYGQRLEGEVRRRTADLVESERLYRETFDEAPVGIVHVGHHGQWLRVNQRLCDLLGYSSDELRGPVVQALMHAEDGPGEAEWFRQMAAGALDHYVVDERQYPRRDGGMAWARVLASAHRDVEGRPLHFILVIEDITERRKLEAQVRQATKMDAVGRLASGVAHDFNNLLTVILGCAELMATDADLAAGHAEEFGEIVKAAHRAAGLTKQLLAFGRQQVLRAAPVDVNTLVREMTGMLGRLMVGEGIEMTLALSPTLSLGLADRGQLEQVVMNLVVNARDAMPGGGTVTIATTDVELEDSPLHEEPVTPGPYVMIAITDTGSGMSRETQRRLFEPFFTTKEVGKGTGLGLSTTYGIVKQSKGYIWVSSELGRGTTFTIYLPRAASVPAEVAVSAIPDAPQTGSETVLLVEDESGVRLLTKRFLDKAGYRVLEAANGNDAERVFAQHGGAIDLVVTDVMMPDCGGPELIGRLQEKAPALRVLYMSGFSEQSALRNAGIELGVPFVHKPFTASELVRQVRHALDHEAVQPAEA
jgi:PAS domain S-box-containing protein